MDNHGKVWRHSWIPLANPIEGITITNFELDEDGHWVVTAWSDSEEAARELLRRVQEDLPDEPFTIHVYDRED